MKAINIEEKLAQFDDYWNPRIIGELNEQLVKIAKFKGEFEMHKHDAEDELFHVIKGEIKVEFEHHEVILKAGEMLVIPKGVLHKPSAIEEAQVLMFEPASIVNTGENGKSKHTRLKLDSI